jgi:hypothetical protein
VDRVGKGHAGQGNARMTQDAYTRIALRLRELSPADREWLLGQLAPEDCSRVSEALRQHRAQVISSEPADHARVEEGSDIPVSRLRSAPAARVKALLAEEPDWAIALVLSAESWPWTQEFLDELVPERIRALRAMAGELSPRVKPKFAQALVRFIAAKLQPTALQSPVTVAFDAALERALNDLPVVKHWPSDRV